MVQEEFEGMWYMEYRSIFVLWHTRVATVLERERPGRGIDG